MNPVYRILDVHDKSFGEAFRICRKYSGMTRAELSNAAKIPASTIANVEAGRNLPRIDTAMLLLEALDLKMSEFMAMIGK